MVKTDSIPAQIEAQFGNTGKFHPLSRIIATIDAQKPRATYLSALSNMKRTGRARIEMQPGARGDNHYRIWPQKTGTMIPLNAIERRLKPFIKELLETSRRPISHRSSGEYIRAAGELDKMLREWKERSAADQVS